MGEKLLLERINAALESRGEKIRRIADGVFNLTSAGWVLNEDVNLTEVAQEFGVNDRERPAQHDGDAH